jgi:hypothetical protein
MDWLQAFLPLNLERLSVWIGVLCTLAIYSLLYRENPIYRFFEHMYIGLAAGYSLGPLGVTSSTAIGLSRFGFRATGHGHSSCPTGCTCISSSASATAGLAAS